MTNSQQRLTSQLCPLSVFQKRPNKPRLGAIRASPSKLQNKNLCVTLRHSMLHLDSGLPWWLPAVNIWNPFTHSKEPPRQNCLIGPRDVVRGGRGGTPWWLGGDWVSARYSSKKRQPELRALAQCGCQIFLSNNFTVDLLVKASRKILELMEAFLVLF